jgi:hypothetical protein
MKITIVFKDLARPNLVVENVSDIDFNEGVILRGATFKYVIEADLIAYRIEETV